MGFVMDFGDDVSHTMTIYEGYALLHSILRWNNIIVLPNVSVVWSFFASQISLSIGFHTLILNPLSSSGEKVAWGLCGVGSRWSQFVFMLADVAKRQHRGILLHLCWNTQKRHRSGAAALRSPAVKLGHGFKILNLTLEFEYLVSCYPQDGNINLGIGISNIVIHGQILVDNPSGSVCGGHDLNFGFGSLNATELAVVAPIGSAFTLHVQGSRSISLKDYSALHFVWSYLGFHANPCQKSVKMTLWCTAQSDAGPSTSTLGTQVITRVPVTTTYAMTFAPVKSVADWQVDSVRGCCLALRSFHFCRDVRVQTA